jgi:hypothetical protein
MEPQESKYTSQRQQNLLAKEVRIIALTPHFAEPLEASHANHPVPP